MAQQVISKRASQLFMGFGMVCAGIEALARRPPASKAESFEQYLASFGPKQPDEPAIVVKVSIEGEHDFKGEGEHDYAIASTEGLTGKNLSLLEVPQDYFYQMRGYHQGSFEIGQAVPPYFYGMGVLQLHTLFEVYLEDLLETLYEYKPSLMPPKFIARYEAARQRSDESRGGVVDEAVLSAMRLPLVDVLCAFRDLFGFTSLPASVDAPVMRASLIRNSIAHGGAVSVKLAAAFPLEFSKGEQIVPTAEMLQETERALRQAAFALEQARPSELAARQTPAFGEGLNPF